MDQLNLVMRPTGQDAPASRSGPRVCGAERKTSGAAVSTAGRTACAVTPGLTRTGRRRGVSFRMEPGARDLAGHSRLLYGLLHRHAAHAPRHALRSA